MPIYEYYCLLCDYTFELLTSLSESTKKKPCPECGHKAPRTVSAFAIASGGNGHHEGETPVVAKQPQDPRPLCMKYPQVPLSCHMDEPSLKRFVPTSKDEALNMTTRWRPRPSCGNNEVFLNQSSPLPLMDMTTITSVARSLANDAAEERKEHGMTTTTVMITVIRTDKVKQKGNLTCMVTAHTRTD